MDNSSSFTSTTSSASVSNTTSSSVAANNGSNSSSPDTVLARAIFENTAEVTQELSFARGDILTVLKRDPPGFEGWWICSFASRVGIAPGNRLEILGSVKPKNRNPTTIAHRTSPASSTPSQAPSTSLAAASSTTTVTAQVNPPDPDPYDELPAVIEIPPTSTPHHSSCSSPKMDQSMYANFYENFPAAARSYSDGGGESGSNGPTPHSQTPQMSRRRATSPGEGAEEGFFSKSVTTPGPTDASLDHAQSSLDQNNRNIQGNQAQSYTDNIPRRSVKRSGLSSVAQSSKHSVRFLDPAPSEVDASTRSRDSTSTPTSTTVITRDAESPVDPLHRNTSWPSSRHKAATSPEVLPSSGPSENADNGPLVPPITFRLTRSTSVPFSSRNARSPNSFSSWQQTHTRIEMLLTEVNAIIDRSDRGAPIPTILKKLRNFEPGLSSELTQLERLCKAFHNADAALVKLIQEEGHKIARIRESQLPQAFQSLKESDPGKRLKMLTIVLEEIALSSQAIFDAIQLNWLDCTDSDHCKRGGNQMDDYIGSLSISDREDSFSTSLDSSDPPDLAGLLHIYSAQFHSHSLLVRGTAEEFLSNLQTKASEPSSARGYRLPTAGVLIANAKFLLRCSGQLVSLAANLSKALQNLPPSETSSSVEAIEKFRGDLEAAGNSVCESLKGLIAQTKDVAGCMNSPILNLPSGMATLASKSVVVLGPEMERLVGAVQDVVATTETLRQTVTNSPVLRSCSSSSADH